MSEKTFAEVLRELQKPFSTSVIQWRPGATNKAKTRAQALAYVDVRHYMERLDAVAPDWRSEVQPLGNGQVLVRLTVAGVTRTDVGEADPQDANTLTSAFAQAFKRACAQFGLGRYLYHLPKSWVAYDADRKALLETPVLPGWAVPEEERSAFGGQRKVPVGNGQATAQTNGTKARTNGNGPKPTSKTNGNGKGKGQDPASVVIRFGKHQGKTLGQILAEDKGYLEWLAEKSNNQFIAKKARQLLNGEAPKPKAEAPTEEPSAPEHEANPYDEIPF